MTFYRSWQPLYKVTACNSLTVLERDAIDFVFTCRPGISASFVLHEEMRCGSEDVVSAFRHWFWAPMANEFGELDPFPWNPASSNEWFLLPGHVLTHGNKLVHH